MTRLHRTILAGTLTLAGALGCGGSIVGSGTGGSGGSIVGSGTGGSGGGAGSPDPNVCGARAGFGLHLLETVDDLHWSPYDGPATVEQSTTSALVLVHPFGARTDPGAPPPDGGSLHATITGLAPMPLFPVGAKVWMSENPANRNTQRAVFYHDLPFSMSVRDREGGTLLFGAALDQFDTAASPVRIGTRSDDCTGPNPMQASVCAPGPNITYQAIEVDGDTPVVVHDSQTGRISLGGVEYDVRLTARRLSDPPTYFNCTNQEGIALDIQAVNLMTLVGALDVGTAP